MTDLHLLPTPERPRRATELRPKLASLTHAFAASWIPGNPCEAAAAGAVDWLKTFARMGFDLNEGDAGFGSPLEAAAGAGERDAVQWLLAQGVDVYRVREGVSPLGAALVAGDLPVLECLLAAGAPVESARASLYGAMAAGRVEGIARLERAGLDLDSRSVPEPRRDQLALAAEHEFRRFRCAAFLRREPWKHLPDEEPAEAHIPPRQQPRGLEGSAREAKIAEVLELLQQLSSAEIVHQRVHGLDPLAFACREGLTRVVGAMLARGVPPERPEEPTTPLMWAAQTGRSSAMDRLLSAGADPNRSDEDGTPLHRAVEHGAVAPVQRLLAEGADPSVRAPDGDSVFDRVAGPYASTLRRALLASVPSRLATLPERSRPGRRRVPAIQR